MYCYFEIVIIFSKQIAYFENICLSVSVCQFVVRESLSHALYGVAPLDISENSQENTCTRVCFQ